MKQLAVISYGYVKPDSMQRIYVGSETVVADTPDDVTQRVQEIAGEFVEKGQFVLLPNSIIIQVVPRPTLVDVFTDVELISREILNMIPEGTVVNEEVQTAVKQGIHDLFERKAESKIEIVNGKGKIAHG